MLKAGTARQIINNELGTDIQAAGHMKKVQRIHDDLEANARGSNPTVSDYSSSHAISEVYLERLRAWLCTIANEAVSSAEAAEIATSKGHAEIGYNRRVCLTDGAHIMHGDPRRPDATGLEGQNDPQHTALFIRTPGGALKAVLYNNTAHPVNFYGADFLCADFPGRARQFLRDVFGNIPVLFFNGAIGDISIYDEFWKQHSPETAEQRVARTAHLIAGETLRLLQHAAFTSEMPVVHRITHFDANLRPLAEERLQWARRLMQDYRNGGTDKAGTLDIPIAHMTLLFYERFGDKTTEIIDLHAGRIGEFAFVTVPCEIFCHFGLQLKRRSPFPITAIFGITNGEMGYCPTIEGVMGGSWEGTVSLTSRWDVKTGYRIVDEWSRMLHEIV